MWSVLVTAWRVIVRRAISDRVILSAAVVTILLATILLASGPIYADAVTLSGVQRTLRDAPVTEANAEITFRATPDTFVQADRRVNDEIARSFALTGGTVYRRGTSESHALPDQPGDTVTNLAVFSFFDRLPEHASLTGGAWPVGSDEPYQAAIPAPTAALLDLHIGDQLIMTNRRDGTLKPQIRIVGIYEINNPLDPYWFDDMLDINGIRVGQSFTTYGPFVVDPEIFIQQLTTLGSEISWRIYPDIDNLEVGDVTPMKERLQQIAGRLNASRPPGSRFQLNTGLITILDQAEESLLVTRSSVLILVVQLAILAGYALLLTAGLIVEQRRVETNLLRSRGADNRQILTMALMEGALLTLPAAIAAPWLATLLLRIFNSVGPLADINLTIDPTINRTAYVLSALAALGSLAALTIPAFRSARAFNNPRAERGRQQSRSLAQRAGLDLALLVVAGVGFWQLRRFGAPITENVKGDLGLDPLLIAAPALGLLAGAIVALRTIPLMARIAEKLTARGTALVPALGSWQVARRPLRYARSALLLMLAIGIGLFAVAYSSTWRQSQEDQAAYQTGADVRVLPDQRFNSAIPELVLRDAYQNLNGYVDSMPVSRDFGVLSRSAGSGRFIMLDAERAADIIDFRSDLSSEPFASLMQRLYQGRPELTGVPIQETPQRIALDLSVDLAPLPPDFQKPDDIRESRLRWVPEARVVLQDGIGQLYRISLGTVPTDGESTRLVADLSYEMDNGQQARPTYPLKLIDIELRASAPEQFVRSAEIQIVDVLASNELDGDTWTPIDTNFNTSAWQAEASDLALAFERPTLAYQEAQPDRGLALAATSGSTNTPVAFPVVYSLRPTAKTSLPDAIPTIVTNDFLTDNDVKVGDVVTLTGLPGPNSQGKIVGSVEEFPTVAPERGEAVILDFQTVSAMVFQPGDAPVASDERWFKIAPGMSADVAGQLAEDPYSSNRVYSQLERRETLASDPVALGTLGSLSMGFVAAAIFAGLGFAVSAAVSARERLSEFALLRAVGLSNRQLLGWLSLEHGLLVVIGLIGGTLLGLLLAWIVLPLVAITQEATEAIPGVIVIYPWLTILWLEIGIVGVLILSVGVLALMLRKLGLGSLLRLGED